MEEVRVVVDLSLVPLLGHLLQAHIWRDQLRPLRKQCLHHTLTIIVRVEVEQHRRLRTGPPILLCSSHNQFQCDVAHLVSPAFDAHHGRERPLFEQAIRIGSPCGCRLLDVEPALRDAHL